MKPRRSTLAALSVAALVSAGACGGGSQIAKDSGGTNDTPAAMDTPPADTPAVTDTPVTPDGGVEDTASPPADAADAGAMDAPGIECAPVPTPGPTPGPTPAGTEARYDAGPMVASTATRPELLPDVADASYTILQALAQGSTINGGTVPDGGVGAVTYALNDNWDPLTNGIGDVSTFTPTYTVATDGSGTHTSLHTAFADAIFLAGCQRIYIRMMPGEHSGRVILNSKASAPPITVYSTEADASKVRIVADAAAATAGSMTNSATLTIKAITGFQMKNVTVANTYVEDSATGNQTAVAMLLQTDRSQFENVRFVGNVGTLYVKSVSEAVAARAYFRNCTIEGDQDFIVGRGTAVFDHCEIKYLSGRQPTGGTIGNPSTLVFNRYGFLFDSCNFTAEPGASGVFLGRQWMEESDTLATRGMPVGKMIVRNSTLGAHLAGAPWTTGTRTNTPKDPAGTTPIVVYTSDDYFPAGVGPTPPEPFLGEYRNAGPGAHQ